MRAPLQFVLDFFTGGDPVTPNQPTPSILPPEPTPSPGKPLSTSVDAFLGKDLPLATGFTHPAANRHAQLQGVVVSFRFERSRRKSIGFMVGADGLVVRAPNWVTLREVDAAVQEKGVWIVAKLQQFKDRQTEQFQKAIEWRHGADVPFLGRTLQLCVLERGVGRVLGQDLPPDQILPVAVPPGASVTQVRDAAQVWLKRQAKTLF